MPVQYYEGIGRRKESTARVRLTAGAGEFVVNEKKLEDFFGRYGDQESILLPLAAQVKTAIRITSV
jgi:small subunit ribosomal protein S9